MTTLTIKNLKFAEFASEETLCFEATLYVDGKSVGHVRNAGKGGPNEYDSWDTERELIALVKAANIQVKAYGTTLTKDLDWIVGDLVNEALLIKDAKALRTKVAKKGNYKPEQIRIFHWGDHLMARGVNHQSDDEVAAEVGEGARRVDNITPSVTI